MPFFTLAQGVEICGNSIDDDGDGLIDCFDGDCSNSKECDGFYYGQGNPECSVKPDENAAFSMKEAWRSSVKVETRGTAAVGDIDGDGYPEVIAHTIEAMPENVAYILDGKDGTVQSTIAAEFSAYSQSPSIADINRDGLGEVYLVDKYRELKAFDHEGNPLTGFINSTVGHSNSNGGANSAHPSFCDFDADGIAEIYMGNQIFNGLTGALIGEPPSANTSSQGSINQNAHLFSAADDVLPDDFCVNCSGPELICGNVVYSVDISSGLITPVSNAPNLTPSLKDGKVSLADWNGDNQLDVIVSTTCCSYGGAIYIWDPRSQAMVTHDAEGNLLKNNPLDAQTTEGSQVGLPSIGDFDGDGYLEMALAGKNEFFMIDGDMEHEWIIPSVDQSSITTATAFDFNGDGKIEVVYRDENNLFIIDGTTGNILTQEQCGSGTRTDLPIVADVDADGEAEIICMCADKNGGTQGNVRVYETASDPWMPTRRVWNTHTYSPVYVNDDLTIPAVFQNKALVDGQDLYLSQTSLISENGTDIYPSLPDLVVRVDSVVFDNCYAAFGDAYITVCNEDLPSLVYDFPISYFTGDPTKGGVLIGTKTLDESNTKIEGSRCINTSFSVPAGNYELYVVVNDDGSDPSNAPIVTIEECDKTNNIYDYTVSNCTCIDTDDDGVCDTDDLDDDNDGILDRNECQISDFHWSSAQVVNNKTATGTINGIGYTYTSSIDIQTTPSIYQYENFPVEYNVPNTQGIKNQFISENTIEFETPLENPTLLFSSIGGTTTVPIKFSNPMEVLFQDGPLTVVSSTEISGKETDLIVRINGTHKSISFNYLADENYVNFTFGADFLTHCDTDSDGIPDYLDFDSDNDACPDAVEGDGPFVFVDIKNGELKGGIDEFGIPSVAGFNGQTVGTSQDESVLSGICSPNLIQEDTFYICLGDSVQIESIYQIEPVWTGDSLYLINDSIIKVFPIVDTKYNVESFIKRQDLLVNSDFEDAKITGDFQIVDALMVGGWSTTASDNKIEIWTDGFQGHPSYSGNKFAELNANMPSALYQDVSSVPGESLKWGFAHRGRNGDETMLFQVGPSDGPYETIGTFEDGKDNWEYYSGVYKVPDGQTTTRFYFTSNDGAAQGNLIDGAVFESLINQYDSVYVIVHQIPNIDLENNLEICLGDTLPLDAQNLGATYKWNTGESIQEIKVSEEGFYDVLVTNEHGCIGYDTTFLKVHTLPIFDLGEDTAFCAPNSLIVNAGDWETYLWKTGSTKKEITVDSSQWVEVLITDVNTCSLSDSLYVRVNPLPIIELGKDTTLCTGSTITLDAGNEDLNISWNTGDNTFQLIVDTGFFKVTVVDGIGCRMDDSITVDLELISDPYRIKEFEFCAGDSITLQSDVETTQRVKWIGFSDESLITVKDGGSYYSEVSGEFCADTFELIINRVDTPDVFIFNEKEGDLICFDFETIYLEALGEVGVGDNLMWSTGEEARTIEISDSGYYSLIASNYLCSAKSTIKVKEYCPGKLFIPNAFTPDKNGTNEEFKPKGYNIEEFKMFIYNRWGEMIFKSTDLEIGWDGTFNGGAVQIDVYLYKIYYTYYAERGGLSEKSVVGTVTLLK